MIVKFTLFGLILALIVVIAASYYVNKEGFDDISNGYLSNLSNELSSAVNTVSTDVSNAVGAGTGSGSVTPATQGVNDSGPAVAPATIVTPSQADSSTPVRTEVVPQVSISGTGYDAMNLQQKAELLKDIQKVVRNEVLASRSTQPILSGETRQKPTESTAQGQEYSDSCYKDSEYRCPKNPDGSCPPVPDMSEYIKKDQIPCWGCALDY
jgi:predicted Abi (CAAX) family protease